MSFHNTDLLVGLIKLYIEKVHFFSAKLSEHLELDNLCDWRQEGVSNQGYFGKGWTYAFHGSGCCIVSPDMEIDFEFDEGCQVGGVDAWRLWSFVCDNQNLHTKFEIFLEKKKLYSSFDVLLNNGVLKINKGLYFLELQKKSMAKINGVKSMGSDSIDFSSLKDSDK